MVNIKRSEDVRTGSMKLKKNERLFVECTEVDLVDAPSFFALERSEIKNVYNGFRPIVLDDGSLEEHFLTGEGIIGKYEIGT